MHAIDTLMAFADAVDWNAQNESGDTVLMQLVRMINAQSDAYGNTDRASMLLTKLATLPAERAVDCTLRNARGDTLLHCAALSGFTLLQTLITKFKSESIVEYFTFCFLYTCPFSCVSMSVLCVTVDASHGWV